MRIGLRGKSDKQSTKILLLVFHLGTQQKPSSQPLLHLYMAINSVVIKVMWREWYVLPQGQTLKFLYVHFSTLLPLLLSTIREATYWRWKGSYWSGIPNEPLEQDSPTPSLPATPAQLPHTYAHAFFFFFLSWNPSPRLLDKREICTGTWVAQWLSICLRLWVWPRGPGI